MSEPSLDVAVITPWYPTRELPFRGAFVQAMVEATAPQCDRMTVYHCYPWPARLSERTRQAVAAAYPALAAQTTRPGPTVAGAELVPVPVPMDRGPSHAEIARRSAAALHQALGGRPLRPPVVHAHVGLPGGWIALHNAGPGARVYVTEHATFLDQVLAEPDGRRMYDELLHRCTAFFAVGEAVRTPLVKAFPHHAERIDLIANPIAFDRPRPEPVTELRRWLYVGGLIPRKGVTWLLEAFAVCHRDDPALTLTLVGEGELRAPLAERAAALGLAGAVRFAGAVPPARALELMREHDLLVHASRMETFGVTIVEAIAAGMPVLVTRCGGPEETLAGIESAAGELVDVEESPDAIIAGYRRLRARWAAGLDPAPARQALAARYGYPAVARAHRRLWFPDQPAIPVTRPAPAVVTRSGHRVLFLALGASRRRVVVEESAAVLAHGGQAVVVVERASTWAAERFAPGVQVLEAATLADLPARPGVTTVKDKALFGAPRRLARLLGRGRLTRPVHRAAGVYERRLAGPLDRRLLTPAHRRLQSRPWLLRQLERRLGGRRFDLLVVTDPGSMPYAVRLLGGPDGRVRRVRGLRVGYHLDQVAQVRAA